MVIKYSKRDHEKYVATNLVKSLKLIYDFERMGDDKNEPDVILKNNSKTIGIEICLTYYDNSDARQEWTLTRGEREFPSTGYEHRYEGTIIDPDNLICSKIQEELEDKCSKKYLGVDESWLCIEARAPLTDRKSLNECMPKLEVPKNSSFKHIWLCYRSPLCDGGGYQVVEIVSELKEESNFSK